MKKTGIIDKLRQASEEGNLEAKYSLGDALTSFISDRAKMDEGIKWLREAAREGHEGALKKLASMEIPLEESPEIPPAPTLEKDKVQPSSPEPPNKVKSTKVKPILIAVSACVLIGLVLLFVLPSMKLKGLEKDASQGKPEAQMALGVRYMEGKGVQTDQVKGMDLIKLAAEQGYPEAAEFFRSDLTAKAEKGDPQAQYDLAISYMEGKYLLKVDSSKGWDWVAKAAKQGHKDASEMVRRDLTAKAEKGDLQAQYDLAMAYMEGKYLLKVDSSKGWDWVAKAAKQGHKDASEMVLGKMRDDLIARAEKGDPQAQYDLAMAYMEGRYLLKVDSSKGWDWVAKAAKQGHKDASEMVLGKQRDDLIARAEKGDLQAQYDLAMAYMEGKYLLEVDSSKGWDWVAKAAKQGHKDASEMVLGKMRDDLIARAEKGDPQAQYDLAMAYLEGKYLLKVDDTKGFDWMFKAYRQGHKEATKFTLTVLAREANRGSTECIEYLNGINDLEEIRFLRSLSYYVPLKVLSWGSDSSITDAIKRLDLVDVSAGWSFSIGLLRDGSLVAWGSDKSITSKTPKGKDFVAISAGSNHGLALKKDGSIVAWGSDREGQLSTPRGNDFVAVSAGWFHSLALKKDGSVVGWGDNNSGQASTPMGKDFVAISAGWSHSLALKKDGSIVAWGSNVNGQCSVPKGNDFVAVSAGEYHSLALKRDGSLVAWGSNSNGQISVPKGSDFVAISTGGNYSLALRVDGSVETWGSNRWGQLAVPHGASFVTVSAGRYHALGLVKE